MFNNSLQKLSSMDFGNTELFRFENFNSAIKQSITKLNSSMKKSSSVYRDLNPEIVDFQFDILNPQTYVE
jgi:hypothetical protein